MDIPAWILIAAIAVGSLFVVTAGLAFLVRNFYLKVEQGEALIVNKTGAEPSVSFTGGLVLPIIHKAEKMDISLKTIELRRAGKDGLICADKIRADIQVTFYIRVNKTEDDVKRVAGAVGCQRASDQQTLENLFLAKFSEALKTVGYQLKFEDLYKERDQFKESILGEIGTELNGYQLDAAAIDYLEQTPLEALDPDNVLDSEGIRAITEVTAEKHVETNYLQREEEKRIKKQNVEAREAILSLERQQAAAEAAQAREVSNVRAREKAEIDKVNAEEHLKAQGAKIRSDEEIQITNENKMRQVEVAQKNRERVIAVETERVERERMLEVIAKERDVELQRIEKDKALEKEKKEIADIVRGRVAVDKTVAEEEELIKDLRATSAANRSKDVTVITAEAEAQEKLVKDIKQAEAQEKAAGHYAKERLINAEADLEAADKEAAAKIRRAEGVQAEVAANGLAEVRVKEADAVAVEKQGMVDARVHKEKMVAQAEGTEQQGMANVRVREADAAAKLKLGQAEAEVNKEKLLADAKGNEEQGMAQARIREADAQATAKIGQAEAIAIREKGTAEATAIEMKLGAEAKGLAEKAEAMKALDGVGREHEEFRLELEKDQTIQLEAIAVQKDMALAQARILGEAFSNAKIDIVGGDGQFFDRFVNAVTVGKSVDGFINKSDAASSVLKEYLDGSKSLPADVVDILSRPKLGADDIQKLTISAVLGRLMGSADTDGKAKITELMAKAKELGIDNIG